ncbi:hypothetical protein [Phenylobacterium sp.]|uniref:hypothetical protein n=1 Tax=Phenylobacterium sp. TaxID=1871053 RepID=UPI002DEBC5E5|nr:hypothetical protein [Phenylobacterium sp.]
MDIHKPKPWHGLREFLKEIGTIVIGVLIALGAEQLVEKLHWRDVVASERMSLDAEVANHWNDLHSRVEMQSCVDGRLTELAALIARHDAGQPLGRLGPVGRPMYFGEDRAAWQMAVADQSLQHMDPDLRARYARTMNSYDLFIRSANDERAAWLSLQQINHAPVLSAADWSDVRRAYDRAADANAVLKRALVTNAKTEWLQAFDGFELPKTPASLLDLPAVKDLCKPMMIS